MSQVEDEEIWVTRHFGHKITQQQVINAQGKQKQNQLASAMALELSYSWAFCKAFVWKEIQSGNISDGKVGQQQHSLASLEGEVG